MDFFYPLTLGIPKVRHPFERKHNDRLSLTYEDWRESLSGTPEEYEECLEDAVLRQLRDDKSAQSGIRLILGEPGAGKSTLLREWHARWLRGLSARRLGLKMPVLVRVKEVSSESWSCPPDAMADRLWTTAGQRTAMAAAKNIIQEAFGLPLRLFTPVWLLDGLDEASTDFGDRAFWERLALLPGDVVATCRTAVFQPVRSEAVGLIAQEYRILGLTQAEQPGFLAKALEAERNDPTAAPELVRQMHANPSLRPLAAIPLLLRLVAQAGGQPELPHNRAGFYDAATNALWARRVRDRGVLYDSADVRDAALATLAGSMGLSTLEAKHDLLRRAGIVGELRDALRQSGLLQFDDQRLSAAFPHLTFQEFHLARSWLSLDFTGILEAHWADPRYEEALGLLIALRWQRTSLDAEKVEEQLGSFTLRWCQHHASAKTDLWRMRRSPYRVALALLERAGVNATDPLLGGLAAPVELREYVASLSKLPAGALALLAKDSKREIRHRVAEHPAASADTLESLARDRCAEVRCGVACHSATPPDTLKRLAKDRNSDVRYRVASNPVTPPEALARLAKDRNAVVRYGVAQNLATPPETLAAFANDQDASVREAITKEAEPAVEFEEDTEVSWDARAELIQLSDFYVRSGLIREPEMVLTFIARLNFQYRGQKVNVSAAKSPKVTDVLALMADDPEDWVRRFGAGPASKRPGVLSRLAQHPEEWVRNWLAATHATPPILAYLAKDTSATVRDSAFKNDSILAEDLWLFPNEVCH